MARPEINELPPHPAINPNFERRSIYGRPEAMCVEYACPFCGLRRWLPISVMRQQMKRPNFTGQCRKCGIDRSRKGYFQTLKRNGVCRRTITQGGYVIIGPTSVEPEDLPIYRATANRNGCFEHRFIMAKHLGRPLRSDECVDHVDGNKTNNAIENLRLYRKGKQEPGSCPGWGTYYHEWQMALAIIRQMKTEAA
jgi:hypothetical protein